MTPEEIASLKRSNAIMKSAIHPDTGELIPFFMRQSSFICFNIPLVFTAIFKRNQTRLISSTILFLNQTNAASMNYGNRNASSSYTNQDIGRGYAGAVTAALTIVFFTRTYLAKTLLTLKGSKLMFANTFLNFFSAACSNTVNCCIM